MATIDEQLFLFGEVFEPEPLTGFLAVLEYADLMWTGSLAFTLVVLLSVFTSYWETLASVAVRVAKNLTLVARASVSMTGWLLKQLRTVSSYEDLDIMLYKMRAMVAFAILQTPPVRFVTAVGGWFFPFNRPELAIMRVASVFICYLIADTFFLSPLSIWLTVIRNDARDLILEYKSYHTEMLADIHHLKAIAFVTVCLLAPALLWFLYEISLKAFASRTFPTSSTATQSQGCMPQEPIQTATNTTSSTSTSISEANTELRAKIRNCEVALRKEQAAVKAANKRTGEILRQFERGTASRIAAEEAQAFLSAEKEKLRKELVLKNCQLQRARSMLRNTEGEHDMNLQKLKDRIVQLEDALEQQLGVNAQAEKDHMARTADLEEKLQMTQPEQALVNRVAELQEQLEGKLQAQQYANMDTSQREIQLMRQLECKTAVEADLRHQLNSLQASFDQQVHVSKTQLYQLHQQQRTQEYLQLQELCREQGASLRQITNEKTQSDHQVNVLEIQVRCLQGEIIVMEDDVKEMEEVIKQKEVEIEGLTVEIEIARHARENTEAAQPLLAQAQPANADPPNNLVQIMKDAYETTLKGERMEAKEAHRLVTKLQGEIQDYKKRLENSLRVANDYREKLNNAEGKNKDLNRRLFEAEYASSLKNPQQTTDGAEAARLIGELAQAKVLAENFQQSYLKAQKHVRKLQNEKEQGKWKSTADDQKIQQKKNPNPERNSTKLQDSQLMVIQLQNDIKTLQDQLSQAKGANGVFTNASEVQQKIANLESLLKEERMRRKKIEVQSEDRNRALFNENNDLKRKLTKAARERETARVSPYRLQKSDPFLRVRR
ncbi:hypothetical protein BDW62DRAFT_197000 [Aspergillus aurantiobrunneus]